MHTRASVPPVWSSWLHLVRAPFLLLTPACMALGLAVARLGLDGPTPPGWWLQAGLALLAGLAGHVSVNALNEYLDFRSGLDGLTHRTPFSGGSGALARRPELAGLALGTGLGALLLCGVLGLHFLLRWPDGLAQLAPLGALGLLLVVAYTPWVTRHPWLCLLAPGLAFGPLMVAGTSYALLGRHTPAAWLAGLVPLFLVNNLLLLNQFPDVDADRAVGRRTLPIALGRPACVWVLLVQWLLAYGALAVAVLLGPLPDAALAGLLTMPLVRSAWLELRRHPDDPARLPRPMLANVVVSLATPMWMAAGIAWAAGSRV